MKLAGNGIHMRACLASLCVILKALDAKKVREYLDEP